MKELTQKQKPTKTIACFFRNTGVDRILDMETYTNDTGRFANETKYLVYSAGVDRIGVGVYTNAGTYTQAYLDEMLQILFKYNVQEVDIWHDETTVSPMWWDFLRRFALHNQTTSPKKNVMVEN